MHSGMDELLRNRSNCPTGNQTLWVLGQVGACGSLCCLLAATLTNYWLKTSERGYTSNGTVYYHVVYSGLWKKCSEETKNSTTTYNCTNIDYFNFVDRDGLGPTEAIILSLRRATPFPMVGLVVMLVAQSTVVACYCRSSPHRHTVTVVLGSFYVAAGLMTLVGIIIYIGAITEEASSKSKPKDDHPAFVYRYGPSLVLAIVSFVGCQLTGVVSINHFIAIRHIGTKKTKAQEKRAAKVDDSTFRESIENKVTGAGDDANVSYDPGPYKTKPRPYSLSPLGTNHLADFESNTLILTQRGTQQVHESHQDNVEEPFSPYEKPPWFGSSAGIRSETLYTVNGEASSVHRCPQTMAASSSPEADTSEEYREELAIKGLALLNIEKAHQELLLSCSSLFPFRTRSSTFTKPHQRSSQQHHYDQAGDVHHSTPGAAAKKNSHRKQKRKRSKSQQKNGIENRHTFQRSTTGVGDEEDTMTAEKPALKRDFFTTSTGRTMSGDWLNFSSAENLLKQAANKRITLV